MGKLKDSLVRLQESVAAEEHKAGKSNKPNKPKAPAPVAAPVDDDIPSLIDELAALKSIRNEVSELKEKSTLSKKEQRRLAKLEKLLEEVEEDEDEEDEEDEDEESAFDTTKLTESASESESDIEDEEVHDEDEEEEEEDDDDEEEEEEEEDVALSDVELDDDADVIPHQKTTVNNVSALKQSLSSITINHEKLPFFEHLSVEAEEPIVLKDIYDDLERELAFYKQGLAAANIARKNFKKEKIPFARPIDYFAEMVKSDEHMDKLKQKLVEEETAKKAAQEARRQRELKKFGKKVQHAKLQERQKEKRETLEKIKSLKRKRGGNEISTDDFDVGIEEATTEGPSRKERYGVNAKRKAKDAKYGHGGKKRFSRQNDASSSADISDFSNKRGKSTQRLGKNKRAARR
ncbi:Ebp2p [Sugiyamaella lignohabitans]|uniref:Ebp2p n=1 Tax=Sugiyamaella lignohabitans TaxID=796027 RepID=A0A167F684_9ASCO|nr:Ebp2p [Sugiyamaella lignohabitans]ANB14889.1 Ebp2p [Sugiyamaella lignohabitans]